MTDKNCPKCEKIVDPQWHKEDKQTHKGFNLYTCDKNSFNKSQAEHLHYYCKCGYDWLELIDKEKGEVIDL